MCCKRLTARINGVLFVTVVVKSNKPKVCGNISILLHSVSIELLVLLSITRQDDIIDICDEGRNWGLIIVAASTFRIQNLF